MNKVSKEKLWEMYQTAVSSICSQWEKAITPQRYGFSV